MKRFKRNAVIVTVIAFVCAAVYLNWSYDRKAAEAEKKAPTEDLETLAEDGFEPLILTQASQEEAEKPSGLVYTPAESAAVEEENGTELPLETASDLDEYFAAVRLSRRQSRDEAAGVLQTVADAEGASQETRDEALGRMTQLADWAVKEAELENLIMTKGFSHCVVYLSEDGVSVTVAADEGLSSVGVARITDAVLSETDFSAGDVKVIEIR